MTAWGSVQKSSLFFFFEQSSHVTKPDVSSKISKVNYSCPCIDHCHCKSRHSSRVAWKGMWCWKFSWLAEYYVYSWGSYRQQGEVQRGIHPCARGRLSKAFQICATKACVLLCDSAKTCWLLLLQQHLASHCTSLISHYVIFYLCLRLKDWLKGCRFKDAAEVQVASKITLHMSSMAASRNIWTTVLMLAEVHIYWRTVFWSQLCLRAS